MKKACSKCGIEKKAEEFGKDNGMKSGLKSQCKQCEREYAAERLIKNREAINERRRTNRLNNLEEVRAKDREYHKNNPDKARDRKKRYRSKPEVKQKEAISKKEYRNTHKEEISVYNKEHYMENPECHREYSKNYRKENPEKARETNRRSRAKRLQNDPIFRRKDKIRKNLYKWITRGGHKKSNSTELTLGCTFDEFVIRAEALFLIGMTWENYGKLWDFDHIIPISYAMTEDEVHYLNHYTNLKPMYSEENRYVKRDNVFYEPEYLEYVLSEWI